MSSYLNYIKTINGTNGRSIRDSFLDGMVDDYNNAHDNVITKFRVMINTKEAKEVLIDGKETKCLIKADTKESETTGNYMVRIRTEINHMNEGSLIEFKNDTNYKSDKFLIMSKVETIKDYSQAYMRYCNRTFKIKDKDINVPCVADNTTYGVKGLKDNGLVKEPDAKLKCVVQATNTTKQMVVGMRILFKNESKYISNNDEWVAYKVMKKDFVVLENQYVMELELSTILTGLDDLENGIAYNPMLDDTSPPVSGEFKIIGDEDIAIGETKEYYIEPASKDRVAYRVDDVMVAEIIEQDFKGKCKLKGLKEEYVKLDVIVGNVLKDSKWILVY